jgi:hypothetical protein
MPLAALADSEYLAGVFGSSTSPNVRAEDEHSPSALGHSEVAAVENPPCHAVPDLGQRSKQLSEVPTAVRGEQSGYVLDEKPAGSNRLSDAGELEEQAGSLPGESCAASGDAEVLAGEPTAEEIRACPGIPFRGFAVNAFVVSDGCQMSASSVAVLMCDRTNVVKDGDSGEPGCEDGPPVLVPLAEEGVMPAGLVEAEVESPDAGEGGDDIHATTLRSRTAIRNSKSRGRMT